MKGKEKQEHRLNSNNLLSYYKCPRRAWLTKWGEHDQWPNSIIKATLDDYLVKKSKYNIIPDDHLKRMRSLLEPIGVTNKRLQCRFHIFIRVESYSEAIKVY